MAEETKAEEKKPEAKQEKEQRKPPTMDDIYDALDILSELAKIRRGDPDIIKRMKVIADPKSVGLKNDALSNLSPDQIDVAVMKSNIEKYFPSLRPLVDSTDAMMEMSKSLDALGLEKVVELEQVENFLALGKAGRVNINANASQGQQQNLLQEEGETKK